MLTNNKLPVKLLYIFLLISIVLALLFLSNCQKNQETLFHLEKTSFANLPGWEEDNIEDIIPVFTESCKITVEKDINYPYLPYYNHKRLKETCQYFLESKFLTPKEFRNFIQTKFVPYKVISKSESLFTGYYAPVVQGSFIKTNRYKFPVYTRPDDLVTVPDLSIFIPEKAFFKRRISGKIVERRLVPYFTREKIENGAIAKKNLEIIWLDNKIDLFFLQIQGSGLVELPNGSRLTLSYNGTNGHKYTPIGKYLIEIGAISKKAISMQSIRNWLENNPEKITEVLNKNKSYVFSEILKDNRVYGSQKTKLQAGRSVAIDLQYFPLGSPVWIDTKNPTKHNSPMQFLAMTQDTGGAIKGSIRADIFCGYGKKASELAGKLKERGAFYILLPKKS